MSDFSIQKMFASAVNEYGTGVNKNNWKKQQISVDTYYGNLLGTHLGHPNTNINPNTDNTAATKVD